jgi:hypothetical protein
MHPVVSTTAKAEIGAVEVVSKLRMLDGVITVSTVDLLPVLCWDVI